MPRNWTDQYTFLHGAVASPTLAFFVTHEDETARERIPYSSFLTWRDGEWIDGGSREWPTVSLCAIPGDMIQLLAISEAGRVFLKGGGEEREELIVRGDEGPTTRGPMRCVRAIAGQVFAVGSDRQVYRRKGPSRWEALDAGARPEGAPIAAPPEKVAVKASDKKRVADKSRSARGKPPAPPRAPAAGSAVGFHGVDGFAANELYAVGRRGEIWQWDGTRWAQRSIGGGGEGGGEARSVDATLTEVTCAADGVVYIAGEGGVLLRGRNERWEVLPTGTSDAISGLRLFEGGIYAATARGVYRHEGGKLVAVPLPKKDAPKTFGKLDAVKGALWSMGGKDIFTYDGKSWTRIE